MFRREKEKKKIGGTKIKNSRRKGRKQNYYFYFFIIVFLRPLARKIMNNTKEELKDTAQGEKKQNIVTKERNGYN